MNFDNFAEEGWGCFEKIFWWGTCCERGGQFSKGGSGVLEKAIMNFTSRLLFNLLFKCKFFFRVYF